MATSSNLFDQLSQSFSGYVVTPLNAFGLAGFVFDVEGETIHNLSAEITDHWTESNYAVQDHIAIKPKKIILRNYVGELVDRQNNDSNTTLQQVARKLTTIGSYLPKLSSASTQAYNLLNTKKASLSFDDALANTVNIYSIFKNLNPPVPRQQQAYQFFKALMEQKILVAVQTPFEYATNMAIESVVATQPEGSRFISDFSITLKEIRLAKTGSTPFSAAFAKQTDPSNAIQSATEVNAGKIQGVTDDVSNILSKGWTYAKGLF